MKSKKFNNKRQAKAFAEDVRGLIEGPFVDNELNGIYIVFYKERRVR